MISAQRIATMRRGVEVGYYSTSRAELLDLLDTYEAAAANAPTMLAVLCQNDFPFAVFASQDDAFAEKQKRNDPDNGIYFHIRSVPFCRASEAGCPSE